MSPQWNTTERGKTREDEDGEQGDYDGYSCMHVRRGLLGSVADVEDLHVLQYEASATSGSGANTEMAEGHEAEGHEDEQVE
jgi:hypothetical protein